MTMSGIRNSANSESEEKASAAVSLWPAATYTRKVTTAARVGEDEAMAVLPERIISK